LNAQEQALVQNLLQALSAFENGQHQLPGIHTGAARNVFAFQLVDSIRRVKYVSAISARQIDPHRADPSSEFFDPLRAAILKYKSGDIDEACWLVFLFVHFGRHHHSRWRYAREVYGALGQRPHWTWANTSSKPADFRQWLSNNESAISRGTKRGFGNHRKYLSLSGSSTKGTGAAVQSYVEWVLKHGSHAALITAELQAAGGNAQVAFDRLYRSMAAVVSFGRIARFDYLTMLGKIGLANIAPGSPYLFGATGPLTGAKLLLVGGNAKSLSTAELDQRITQLGHHLGVGMQVMEDAVCNWQKSPSTYKYFSG
jgi:hypothetical protein